MSEHLVRWKFGPNSLLNHKDVETPWYEQFYPNKNDAVIQYVSLLRAAEGMSMTVEIFRLTKLKP
jgi:hypothetical protein